MKYTKNLLNAIDYMFYRIEKVYFKKEGEGTFSACMVISLFFMFLILSPSLIILNKEFIKANKTLLMILTIAIQLTFLFITYTRYNKIGDSLKSKWDNEKEPNKTNHGILIVFILLFPIILLFLIP
jgi:hypothetical protein